MTIFTKAKIIKILNDKVSKGEIKSFYFTETYLRISKSKRTGYTFKIQEFTEDKIIRLLQKKTPHPSIESIDNFYTKQIKKLQ